MQEETRAFRDAVLLELLKRDRMTVADLARRIRRPRPTVSVCINRGRFAEVRALIKKELNIK